MNIRKYSDTNIIPFFCCIMQPVVGVSTGPTISAKLLSPLFPAVWFLPHLSVWSRCKHSNRAHTKSHLRPETWFCQLVRLYLASCAHSNKHLQVQQKWMETRRGRMREYERSSFLNYISSWIARNCHFVRQLNLNGSPYATQFPACFSARVHVLKTELATPSPASSVAVTSTHGSVVQLHSDRLPLPLCWMRAFLSAASSCRCVYGCFTLWAPQSWARALPLAYRPCVTSSQPGNTLCLPERTCQSYSLSA